MSLGLTSSHPLGLSSHLVGEAIAMIRVHDWDEFAEIKIEQLNCD